MKQLFRIWILVVAMVMGGALPPQLVGDNPVTAQWSAQAKNKNKKNKKKNKKNKKNKSSASNTSNTPSTSSRLASPPSQSVNALLAVTIPKGVSNQVLNYQSIRVNFNPSLRIPNCVAYELTATMVAMADAPGHEVRKNYNYARDP